MTSFFEYFVKLVTGNTVESTLGITLIITGNKQRQTTIAVVDSIREPLASSLLTNRVCAGLMGGIVYPILN